MLAARDLAFVACSVPMLFKFPYNYAPKLYLLCSKLWSPKTLCNIFLEWSYHYDIMLISHNYNLAYFLWKTFMFVHLNILGGISDSTQAKHIPFGKHTCLSLETKTLCNIIFFLMISLIASTFFEPYHYDCGRSLHTSEANLCWYSYFICLCQKLSSLTTITRLCTHPSQHIQFYGNKKI